jgi:hypothetical protein
MPGPVSADERAAILDMFKDGPGTIATPTAGMSEADYWSRPGLTPADRYADVYGGEVIQVGSRISLPAGWSMRGDRMIAPDGTDMGTAGAVTINIRDGQGPNLRTDISIDRQLDNIAAMAKAYRDSGMSGATGDVAEEDTPAYMDGVGYADENNTFPPVIITAPREPSTGSALLDEGIVRAGGTVLGVAGIVHGGAQLATDQFWALSNAITGGWLAKNNGNAKAAVTRSAALGEALLNAPRNVASLALRMATGNWHGMDPLNAREISALNARGDYLEAQIRATQSALNVAGMAAGAPGMVRSAGALVGSGRVGNVGSTATGVNRAQVLENIANSQAARNASQFDIHLARTDQVRWGYAADDWGMTTLRSGDRVYGGLPGQSSYYTSTATLEAADGSRSTLFQSLQVKAHPEFGYRPKVGEYELVTDVTVPSGVVRANPRLGVGGGDQFFVRDYQNSLKLVREIPLGH